MTSLRTLWDRWRGKSPNLVRRVIVLVLEGFDLSFAERLWDEGLLHYMSTLSDLGARLELHGDESNSLAAAAASLRAAGVRVSSPQSCAATANANLDEICDADRTLQERLFKQLMRHPDGVVIATFDMLARIERHCKSRVLTDSPSILRDVHARMDEHVGKALSFVDESTVLIVAIPKKQELREAGDNRGLWEIFVSRPLPASGSRTGSLVELVHQFLEATVKRP